MNYSFDVRQDQEARTPFPLEMLSRDRCYPTSARDAAKIDLPWDGFGPDDWISLSTTQNDKDWIPSVGHWNKAGWHVGMTRSPP